MFGELILIILKVIEKKGYTWFWIHFKFFAF